MATEAVTPPVRRKKSSSLAYQEASLAWRLLLPTIFVLLTVAVYPLGQAFYTSFTDRKFASSAEPQFVGLDQYVRLLGVTIRELPPIIDEATGQQAVDPDTGELLYERPITVLPREPSRYREYAQFRLFGNRYVVGAISPPFIQAIRDTLIFSVVSVALETVLGMAVALIVNARFRGQGLMRVFMLVPWAIPTIVSARIWDWMFQPTRAGMFNALFDAILPNFRVQAWLANEALQLPAIIAIDVWKTTPYMALLLLAGLQLIPKEIYEAAAVDGAGKVRQFFSLTLPLLIPTLAVALVFRTLDALRVFDLFQVLLGQARQTMASFTYYQLINNQDAGLSSASGVIIFLLIFVFTVLYMRLFRIDEG